MHRRYASLAFLLVLSVSILAFDFPAPPAPLPQDEAEDLLQIALLLDISGSMGDPVLTGELYEQLLKLEFEIERLESLPEFLELAEELETLENDPEMMTIEETWLEAVTEMDYYFKLNGIGDDLNQMVMRVGDLLDELGCNQYLGYGIAAAADSSQADAWIEIACPGLTISTEDRDRIHHLVPYLDEPAYQELQSAVDQSFADYEIMMASSGMSDIEMELYGLKETIGYYETSSKINQLREQGPARLTLAKEAAITLLDLSDLDQIATGRATNFALVTFSNNAELVQPLDFDPERVLAEINLLEPQQKTNIGDALDTALDELEEQADTDAPILIILLSDGIPTIGPESPQILRDIPPRVEKLGAAICTVGFATVEEELDKELLEGLAEETSGSYLFANQGHELAAHFITCRQNAVENLLQRFSGLTSADEQTIMVKENTCQLSLALNNQESLPNLSLTDPAGTIVEGAYPGINVQSADNLQLLTIKEPLAGEWKVVVASQDPGTESAYSLVITSQPCATIETAQSAENETAPDEGNPSPLLIPGIVILVLILGGGGGYVYLRSKKNSTAE
jgi:hypothetical protein